MKSHGKSPKETGLWSGAFRQACRDAAATFPYALAAYVVLVAYLHSPWAKGTHISEPVVHGVMALIACMAIAHWRKAVRAGIATVGGGVASVGGGVVAAADAAGKAVRRVPFVSWRRTVSGEIALVARAAGHGIAIASKHAWRRFDAIRPRDRIAVLVAIGLLVYAVSQDATLVELAMLALASYVLLSRHARSEPVFIAGFVALAAALIETAFGWKTALSETAVLAFEFMAIGTFKAVLELRRKV